MIAANELHCQDCGRKTWKAQIQTVRGPLHLCGDCTEYVIHNREGGTPDLDKRFNKLLNRVFGPLAAVAA